MLNAIRNPEWGSKMLIKTMTFDTATKQIWKNTYWSEPRARTDIRCKKLFLKKQQKLPKRAKLSLKPFLPLSRRLRNSCEDPCLSWGVTSFSFCTSSGLSVFLFRRAKGQKQKHVNKNKCQVASPGRWERKTSGKLSQRAL